MVLIYDKSQRVYSSGVTRVKPYTDDEYHLVLVERRTKLWYSKWVAKLSNGYIILNANVATTESKFVALLWGLTYWS